MGRNVGQMSTAVCCPCVARPVLGGRVICGLEASLERLHGVLFVAPSNSICDRITWTLLTLDDFTVSDVL